MPAVTTEEAEREIKHVCRESASGMEPDPNWKAPGSPTWRKARKWRNHALTKLANHQGVDFLHVSEAFHRGWRAGVLSIKLGRSAAPEAPESFTDSEYMAFTMGAMDGWCSALWFVTHGSPTKNIR